MKKMTLIALAAALVVGASTAIAQVSSGGLKDQNPRIEKRHQMMHRWMSELNLTGSQKAQIKAIRERTKAKLKELKASAGTKDSKKSEFMAIRKSSREEMLAVLTPAQRDKLQAMRAKFRADHPGFGKSGK